MAEQVPCFQLGFDFKNSDDYGECSGEVACSFNKLWSPLIKSCTNFRKPRKRRFSECFTKCYFTVILPMKVSCFLVGRQGVRHEASEDQQLRWREYGGMRNYCFKLTRAVSDMYGIQWVNYFCQLRVSKSFGLVVGGHWSE